MVTRADSQDQVLVVQAPQGASLADLQRLLRGSPHEPVAEDLKSARSVADDEPVLHGAHLVKDATDSNPTPPPCPQLIVAAGPDAGASLHLPAGQEMSIGRGRGSGLIIHDPSLSRRHIRVRHGRRHLQITDMGSTNGFRLAPSDHPVHQPRQATIDTSQEGEPSGDGPVPWPSSSSVLLGDTELRWVGRPVAPLTGTPNGGHMVVRPWPELTPQPQPAQIPISDPPEPREVRPPSIWSWALPLVAALVVAIVMRMPLFLIFGLLGPAMVWGNYLGERRSARRDIHRQRAQWEAECADQRREAERALAEELADRIRRDPALEGPITALVPTPSGHLWHHSDDLPRAVLGHGPLPSLITVGEEILTHDRAPLVLTFEEPIAIVGPADLRNALARSLLFQLCTRYSPHLFQIYVPHAPPPEWDLLAWLPHTVDDPANTTAAEAVVLRWGVDLVLVDDIASAPPAMTRVIISSERQLLLQRPGKPELECVPTLLALPRARDWARRLAPLSVEMGQVGADPARHSPQATLGDLVAWPQTAAEATQWWSHHSRGSTRVVVGTDPAGAPVEIDLARDGPHALLAGTTGSGKSEALRTLVTSLALINRPSQMNFLFIDYKGGSSLGECAQLPHSAGLLTDLDPHLAERMLTSLQAELHRREQLLAQAGARDLQSYDGDDLPRLVVVIDEFRVLADEVPEVLSGLIRVAAVGRSLGVHLVLATQRPAGVVSADLRANVNLRITLRVRDSADSYDVLESDDAAHLPEGQPGRGLIGTGSGTPWPVQVAPALGPSTGDPTEWKVTPVADVWAGRQLLAKSDPGSPGAPLSDLIDVLSAAAEATDERSRPVWLPPLEDRITSDDPSVWAWADRPDEQAREPLRWLARGHLAIMGAARSGRTMAIQSLVRSAPPAWLYVFDLGNSLPRGEVSDGAIRAWVGAGDVAHGQRVIQVLSELVRSRMGRAAAQAPVVVVLDGWDRFIDAYGTVDQGLAVTRMTQVLREGPAGGVHCVLTGDRSLLTGQVSSLLPETWALRMNDPSDLMLTGLRTRQIPDHQPPGRAIRLHDAVIAQVVLPQAEAELPLPEGDSPPAITDLPHQVNAAEAGSWAVGGDEATALPDLSGHVLVLGPHASGVSSTLRSLAARRHDVLELRPEWTPGELTTRLQAHQGTLLIDDAHLLAGSETETISLEWARATSGQILLGASVGAANDLFHGLIPYVARAAQGIVLQPSHTGQGAVLKANLPVGDVQLPGRGVLVHRGRCQRIQVATVQPVAVGDEDRS